jgi:Iron-containing redox enzyme
MTSILPGISLISSSGELKMKLDLAAPSLNRAMNAMWEPVGLTERYLDYLEVMHAVIRASVPMMRAAELRCSALAEDPLAAALAAYFAMHITEELHHDDWLLHDLTAAGRDPALVTSELPSVAVARLVGPQYYWLHHHHPITLLGYIAVMEGNSPPPSLAGRLATATGLPAGAFRTLHHHAVADLHHSAEFDDFLDSLPLTPGLQRAISVSALSTADSFIDVLTRLTDPTRTR